MKHIHDLSALRLRAIGLSVAALLSLPGLLPAQERDEVEIDVEAIAENISQFSARLNRLRSDIDRSRFEPDAMVEKLDYDAKPLIEFAQTEIAFQPYEGALRGPAGALRARAGNSLDQSVLLAYMLKSAGYDARIVGATLEDDEALRLLQGTQNASLPTSMEYLEPTIREVMPDTPEIEQLQADLTETMLFQTALRFRDELTGELANKGFTLAPSDASTHWLPVVKQYFWVQHRDGPSREWEDAHPAFGKASSPAGIEPREFFADSVPEKYQHKLTASAWIEQWQAGDIKKHRIMDDWSAPTANLNAFPLQFRNAPNGLTIETATRLEEAISSTTMLTPLLNGAVAPGAKVFDLKGRTVDPFALSQGSGGIFQTMGDKLASATGEVMDREDGQPVLALHSMYLEFTYQSPSGRTESRRRYLLAPREDYTGDSTGLLWRLITDHTYMIATGGQPVDFVAERFLNTATESMDWLMATVRKAFHPEQKVVVPEDMPSDVPPLAQYWLMDRRPVLEKDVIAYRAAPSLIGIRRGYRDADTAFAAVDVVWNHVEHVRVTPTGLQRLPQSAVSSGVWETLLESVPGRALQRENVTISSAPRVFDLAREQGIDSIVLSPGELEPLDELQLGAAATTFLRHDLDRGYAIVIPERVPDGAPMAAWWRVHPESGETLGMTGDGYGAEAVEYMIELTGIAKGLIDALQSIVDCDKKTDNVQKMCCLVEAHINNVAGLGFGGLLGATVGTVGATVFDIMNTTTKGATGQGLMPEAKLGCGKMQGTNW